MARLRTRPHPIAAFLIFLILGPYLLAAVLIGATVAVACYLIGAVAWLISGKWIV